MVKFDRLQSDNHGQDMTDDLQSKLSHISQTLELLRVVHPKPRSDSFAIADSTIARLGRDLNVNLNGLLVRIVMDFMQIKESIPFDLGIENKLIQALFINSYSPNTFPRSLPLCSVLLDRTMEKIQNFLDVQFPFGYVIKPVYGSCSQRDDVLMSGNVWLCNPHSAEYMADGLNEAGAPGTHLIQELIPARREHRVHTFSSLVIPKLSYVKCGPDYILSASERDNLHGFVKNVISSVPEHVFSHSVCGWDIAEDYQGQLKVVEINFAGPHKHDGAGFQCSGSLQGSVWGTYYIAHLLSFLASTYGVDMLPRLNALHEGNVQLEMLIREITAWLHVSRLNNELAILQMTLPALLDSHISVETRQVMTQQVEAIQFQLKDVVATLSVKSKPIVTAP